MHRAGALRSGGGALAQRFCNAFRGRRGMTTTAPPEAIKEILLVSAPDRLRDVLTASALQSPRSVVNQARHLHDARQMTKQITNELVKIARGDDEALASSAKDLLVRRLLPVVNSAISKLEIASESDREDARQAAMVRVLTCIERFDPAAGMSLPTYAYGSAQKAAINWLQRERGDLAGSSESGRERVPARSLDALARRIADDADSLDLADVLADDRSDDPADLAARSCQSDAIDREVDRLPTLEREVMILRFGLDGGGERTRAAVAEILNLSVPQIDTISAHAREMLLSDAALERMGEATRIHLKPPRSIDELASAVFKDHHAQPSPRPIPMSISTQQVVEEERKRHAEHVAALEVAHPEGLSIHLEQICADRAATLREERTARLQAGAAAHQSAAMAMMMGAS